MNAHKHSVNFDSLPTDLSRLEFVQHCSLRGRLITRDTGTVHEITNDDLSFEPCSVAVQTTAKI